MRLSVVVPARNEARHLPQQLDALASQPYAGDWEVIVVDNGSTDGTQDIVRERATRDSRFRLIEAPERGDQNYAANRGVDAAQSPNIAFCDADDVVANGWVEAMMRGLENHDVVTGPNEVGRLNPEWLASSRGDSGMEPVGSFCGIFPLVRGNNFGVRSQVFVDIGPLVEGWRAAHDQEFSLRCWLHGLAVVGLPDAVVHYRYRTTGRDLWRQGYAYGSSRPAVARRLRESGQGRAPRFGGWKSWVTLVVRLPSLTSSEGRASWLWIAGNRWGQVVGSVRERTLML